MSGVSMAERGFGRLELQVTGDEPIMNRQGRHRRAHPCVFKSYVTVVGCRDEEECQSDI